MTSLSTSPSSSSLPHKYTTLSYKLQHLKAQLTILLFKAMHTHQHYLSFSHATASEPPMMTAHEAFKAAVNLDVSHSGCTSYYDSPTSFCMPRSVSNLSFQRNEEGVYNSHSAFGGCELFVEPEDSLVRRVCSAGDLQRINTTQHNYGRSLTESSLSSESNMIIEGMNKACRYSPEEKKERIERYRSKRAQRNFNKKIKYECRKTLADSRHRVRGRFVRNDEIDKSPQVQWNHTSGDMEDENVDDDNWISFLDDLTSNSSMIQ